MIKIFNTNTTKQKKSSKNNTINLSSNVQIGRDKLSRLNPMVIPMLAVKIAESPNNQFLTSSRNVILEAPHKLTDKWVDSLNKWVDSLICAAKLDEPELEIGKRHPLGPFVIDKISVSNDEFGTPVIICKDSAGWKWYLRTSKADTLNVGDSIKFVAMVMSHKEGITFLSRPTKIEVI